MRVEPWLQATSITSIHIVVSGYCFSNMRILKAYALTTTTCANNKRTAQLIAKLVAITWKTVVWVVSVSALPPKADMLLGGIDVC